MMSFTKEEDVPAPGFERLIGERDARFGGVSHSQKAEKRGYIQEPEIQQGMYLVGERVLSAFVHFLFVFLILLDI